MNFPQFMSILILCILGTVFIFFWKDILSILKPKWFYRMLIMMKDNNIEDVLVYRKGKTLNDYTFNDCKYLFTNKDFYFKAGVTTWFYDEGFPLPKKLKFTDSGITGSTLEQFQQTKIDGLWYEGANLKDFLADNWIFLAILGLILIMVLYLIDKNANTTALLMNLTGVR